MASMWESVDRRSSTCSSNLLVNSDSRSRDNCSRIKRRWRGDRRGLADISRAMISNYRRVRKRTPSVSRQMRPFRLRSSDRRSAADMGSKTRKAARGPGRARDIAIDTPASGR
jgi:hypothetical protein